MARPVWSGPSEKRNVAPTSCLRKSVTRFGTPSRVPRSVSTSTLRARCMVSGYRPQNKALVDQPPRLGDLAAIGIEDAPQRIVHRYRRFPVEIRARVVDHRHAVLHVLVARSVVFVR